MRLLRYDDFSDGLWLPGEASPSSEQPGFAVPPGGLLQADNVDYLPSGALRGRRGSAKANPAAQRPGAIVAMRRAVQRVKPGAKLNLLDATAFDDDGIPGVEWINPEGAQFPGGEEARANLLGGTQSHYLVRRGAFNFDPIPENATITGVQCSVGYRQALYNFPFQTNQARLFNNGAVIGTAPANENLGVPYASDEEGHSLFFGSSTDKWGLGAGLTPAVVNSEQFGFAFSTLQPGGGGANSLFVVFMGVWVYFTAADEAKFIIGHISGGNVTYETLTAGAFTAITGSGVPVADSGFRPWLVHWPEKEKVFIFNGLNTPRQYNMATMIELPSKEGSGTQPPTGPYAVLHKARIFASHAGELSHSIYASEVNDETNWPPEYHLNVSDDRGGIINGLASWQDYLLIFKDTVLFHFLNDIAAGGQLRIFEPVHGCISADTIQVSPWGVYYLARSGLRLTDGQTTKSVSEAIRSLFTGRTADTLYTNAVGIYFPRKDQYWLKLDPDDADGYVLHRITYPAEGGVEGVKFAWSYMPSMPMNVGEVWEGGEDDGDLYVGDLNGWVWERDTGDQDDSVDYAIEIVTPQRQLDPRTRARGRATDIRPMFRAGAPVAIGLRYDQTLSDDVTLASVGASPSPAEYQEPRQFVSDMTKFGRFLSVRVAASSGGPEFELHRIGAEVRMRSNRRWV
jgi:hypothetical protein